MTPVPSELNRPLSGCSVTEANPIKLDYSAAYLAS